MNQANATEMLTEMLNQIQQALAEVKGMLADHTRQLARLRDDIQGLRGDDSRRELLQARMDVRLERIETSLYLSDTRH